MFQLGGSTKIDSMLLDEGSDNLHWMLHAQHPKFQPLFLILGLPETCSVEGLEDLTKTPPKGISTSKTHYI